MPVRRIPCCNVPVVIGRGTRKTAVQVGACSARTGEKRVRQAPRRARESRPDPYDRGHRGGRRIARASLRRRWRRHRLSNDAGDTPVICSQPYRALMDTRRLGLLGARFLRAARSPLFWENAPSVSLTVPLTARHGSPSVEKLWGAP